MARYKEADEAAPPLKPTRAVMIAYCMVQTNGNSNMLDVSGVQRDAIFIDADEIAVWLAEHSRQYYPELLHKYAELMDEYEIPTGLSVQGYFELLEQEREASNG